MKRNLLDISASLGDDPRQGAEKLLRRLSDDRLLRASRAYEDGLADRPLADRSFSGHRKDVFYARYYAIGQAVRLRTATADPDVSPAARETAEKEFHCGRYRLGSPQETRGRRAYADGRLNLRPAGRPTDRLYDFWYTRGQIARWERRLAGCDHTPAAAGRATPPRGRGF